MSKKLNTKLQEKMEKGLQPVGDNCGGDTGWNYGDNLPNVAEWRVWRE